MAPDVNGHRPGRVPALTELTVAGAQFVVGLRRLGLRATLRRGYSGYLAPNGFIALTCAPGDVRTSAPPADVSLGIWDRERVRAWRAGRAGLPLEFFHDEIHGMRQCAVIQVGAELAGLIWIYRPDDYSRLFRLGPHDVELNHGYILMAHRRRGMFKTLLAFACRELHARGTRAVFAAVHAENRPSLHAFLGAGFREIARLRHFLVFRPRLDTTTIAA